MVVPSFPFSAFSLEPVCTAEIWCYDLAGLGGRDGTRQNAKTKPPLLLCYYTGLVVFSLFPLLTGQRKWVHVRFALDSVAAEDQTRKGGRCCMALVSFFSRSYDGRNGWETDISLPKQVRERAGLGADT